MRASLPLILVVTAIVGAGAGVGAARYTTPAPVAGGPVAVAGGGPGFGGQGQAGGFGGGNGAAGAAQAGAGGAGAATKPGGRAPTVGTLEKVDPAKLTVKTETGSVDVPLTPSATVLKQTKVSLTDLKVGENVFGRAEADASGKLTAHSIQVVPAGQRGFGGQGGNGGPGGNGGEGAGGAGQAGVGAQVGGEAGQGRQRGQGGAQVGGGAQGANGQGGGRQRGSQDGQGARPLFGSIQAIDGKTITLTGPNGATTTAVVADDAQIERSAPAAVADLKAGQTVSVATPPSGDAVVTITG
jgi:hypothetical protein